MECCLCKIFVGNVPFECTPVEFTSCFENFDGFIKAEIIFKSGTNISRGFGFVNFNSPENAHKLLNKNDVFLKDRCLRFSEYDSPKYESLPSPKFDSVYKDKNLIIVKNIYENMTRKELYNIFTKFGDIGKHFIVTDQHTGAAKSYAVVEILDDIMYELLINKGEIIHDTITLQITRWKNPKQKYTNITKQDLYDAFSAGRQMGIMESRTQSIKIF